MSEDPHTTFEVAILDTCNFEMIFPNRTRDLWEEKLLNGPDHPHVWHANLQLPILKCPRNHRGRCQVPIFIQPPNHDPIVLICYLSSLRVQSLETSRIKKMSMVQSRNRKQNREQLTLLRDFEIRANVNGSFRALLTGWMVRLC